MAASGESTPQRGEADWRIRAADRNFVVSFEKLIAAQPDAELRRIGPIVAFDSRIAFRIFNGVAVLEPAGPDDVRAALAWMHRRDIPFTVWVREDLAPPVEPALLADGMELRGEPEPVMGIRPPDQLPPPPVGVSLREVFDRETLEDHIRSNVESGMPEEPVRLLYTDAFLEDPDVRMFTAYLDGRPAGNSVAIRGGKVAGVYGVGVPDELRRNGIGTAVTWAAVRAGSDWGCTFVVLQSSELGFGVYRRMGFEVLTHYLLFR